MKLSVNINAFTAQSKKQRARIKDKASVYVRRKALMVLEDALKVSPQYSGNFVANWYLAVTRNPGGYTTKFKGGTGMGGNGSWRLPENKVRKMGDREAINFALAEAKENLDLIQWNSKITLKNFSPIAEAMEAGKIRLDRKRNARAVTGVIAYLKSKYRFAI